MTQPTYPVARDVAERVRQHFARHLAAARSAGREHLATAPDRNAIETMIDTAFWASLHREEGREPKISLAFAPLEQTRRSLQFREPMAFTAAALAKLAPAVERAGIHLGVWRAGGEFRVWGTTRDLPTYCFVIEVIASGLLVVKERSDSFGKFVNVAVLEGDQRKIVDEQRATVPECPGVLQALLGFSGSATATTRQNTLVQLAASMRAHGRGGILLVVPNGSSAWHESVVGPVPFAIEPSFIELAELMRRPTADGEQHDWQDAVRHAVEAVSGLTAVDGAAIVSDEFEVLAFGAKIRPRRASELVERVIVTEPIEGSATVQTSAARLGGTRHLSAAQFAHDQRDAVALVASQDGRFTIFRWSPREGAVHAHRVEALLL